MPVATVIALAQAICPASASVASRKDQDVFTALPQLAADGSRFDLVLADPPYGEKNVGRRSTSFAQKLLEDPDLPRLLAPDGRFILGHTRRDTLTIPESWRELKLLRHGDSMMRFFARGA